MDELALTYSKKRVERNSLIEILRFVMAWSVLIFHGFMPIKTTILDMGITCVSVDFFLLLGGFLFASSFASLQTSEAKKPFWSFLSKRLKRLGLPFLVALLFALYNTITLRHIGWLFGYLWFIPVEIIGQILLYFFVKYIKRKVLLISLLLSFAIIGYTYFYLMPPDYNPFPQGGYQIYFTNLWSILGYPLRGIGGVFVGYTLTLIPKIKLPMIKIVGGLTSFIAVLAVSFAPYFPYKEFVLLPLFAMTIYLLMQLRFSCPVLNFLGAISFGLYIFQTLGSTLRANHLSSPEIILLIIVAVAILSEPKAFAAIFEIKKKASLDANK